MTDNKKIRKSKLEITAPNEIIQSENAKIMLEGLTIISEKDSWNNQKVLMSYLTILDRDTLKRFIRNIMGIKNPMNNTIRIVIAHEYDTSDEYKTTHALVDFGKQYKCTIKNKFDFSGITPVIRGCGILKDFRQVDEFLTFIDPAELFQMRENIHNSIVDGILECKTEIEAIKKYGKNMKVAEIRLIFNNRELKNVDIKLEHPYTYQKEISELIKETPLGRRITCLYGLGNDGKTDLTKHCKALYPDKCKIITMLNCKDLSTIILSWLKKGWKGDTIFVNLAKTKEDHQIYEALEMLADSTGTAQKYEGGEFSYQKCHIILLSNFLPKFNMLSLDRWNISTLDKVFGETIEKINNIYYFINNNGNKKLVPKKITYMSKIILNDKIVGEKEIEIDTIVENIDDSLSMNVILKENDGDKLVKKVIIEITNEDEDCDYESHNRVFKVIDDVIRTKLSLKEAKFLSIKLEKKASRKEKLIRMEKELYDEDEREEIKEIAIRNVRKLKLILKK